MADIFVTRKVFPELIQTLEAAGHRVEVNDTQRILPPEELISRSRGKQGIVCLITDKIDAAVMDALPDLRVIATVAVGYDNIDIAAATARAILVTHTPGVLTETTADLAFALLLGAARRIAEADAYVRAGRFTQWDLLQDLMGVDVFGKTLGIVGLGRIGQAVARRGRRGFDMRVLYWSRTRRPEVEADLGVEYADFPELLAASDFISIHTPLTPETRHLFSTAEFKAMKSSAILVNTARGPVVDEAALVEALKNRDIAGAGLDVYEAEPAVHPGLLALREFVVLAPHLGSASEETRRRMSVMAAENMIAALAGTRPPHLVNPEAWESFIQPS